jgi:hypothetical protein
VLRTYPTTSASARSDVQPGARSDPQYDLRSLLVRYSITIGIAIQSLLGYTRLTIIELRSPVAEASPLMPLRCNQLILKIFNTHHIGSPSPTRKGSI